MNLNFGIISTLALIAGSVLQGCATFSGETEKNLIADTSVSTGQLDGEGHFATEMRDIFDHADMQSALGFIVSEDKRNFDELIELTQIPAPPFEEGARAERFAEMLKDAGLSDVSIDEVGNVIGRRFGTKGNRTIAVVAHLDTVFPVGTDVTVRVEGDTLHAPGVGDNTRGLIAILGVLRALEHSNIQTEGDILFIGTVGEEGLGDLRGVRRLFSEGGLMIDAMVAVDGGSPERLVHRAVGSHRYRLTITGPGGHSYGAFGTANPHHALGMAINQFVSDARPLTQTGTKTTFSVGRIGGGTSINSIPFESWLEVDMRSEDQKKLDEIDAVFHKSLALALSAENKERIENEALTATVKSVGKRPAGATSASSPLVRRAVAAMKVVGVNAELAASSTDANIPISLGVPAITLSRGGINKNSHSLNESWRNEDSHLAVQSILLLVVAEAGLDSSTGK